MSMRIYPLGEKGDVPRKKLLNQCAGHYLQVFRMFVNQHIHY